jgi:dihydrofolate reductase
MLEIIVAVDEKYGIGKDGAIPWKCSGDLKIFKKMTMNQFVIMGRKTCETLPALEGRDIICVSRGIPDVTTWKNEVIIINSLDEFTNTMHHPKVKYLVSGGSEIYGMFIDKCDKIHMSVIQGSYDCDTFFNQEWLKNFKITKESKHEEFTHYTFERCKATD